MLTFGLQVHQVDCACVNVVCCCILARRMIRGNGVSSHAFYAVPSGVFGVHDVHQSALQQMLSPPRSESATSVAMVHSSRALIIHLAWCFGIAMLADSTEGWYTDSMVAAPFQDCLLVMNEVVVFVDGLDGRTRHPHRPHTAEDSRR